jgi:hypothetical protein
MICAMTDTLAAAAANPTIESARPLTVLLLGSSGVLFAQPGQAVTMPHLIEENLNARSKSTWRVEAAVVYPMPNMAERAMGFVSRCEPDVVLLTLGATVFAEESVIYSVRRGFPRVYRLSARMIERWKAVAGGRAEGARSPRGLLFRLPQLMARRILGTAPLVEPNVALRATEETIERIASVSNLRLVCRLANGHFQHQDQAAQIAARTAEYNRAVRELCERLRIAVYDQRASLTQGAGYALIDDGLHIDIETRRLAAAMAATNILAVAGDRCGG